MSEEVKQEVEEDKDEEIKLNQHGKPDRLFEWKEDCRRAVV